MISINDYENLLEKINKITFNNIDGNSRKLFSIQDTIAKFREKQKNDPIPEIKEVVLAALNFPQNILDAKSRKGDIPIIRQLTAWFYWNYSTLSLSKIAKEISEEDIPYKHTTVLYSIRRINELLTVDKEIRLQVSVITENIKKYYTKVERKNNLKSKQNDKQ